MECSAPGCDRPAIVRGACRKHYYYLHRYGGFSRPCSELDEERFWARVDDGADDECWPWLRHLNTSGYGTMSIKGIQNRAHRLAWQYANGPIPDGVWVLHECDNRACCNPRHLYLGDHTTNMADMVKRGRQAQGERSGRAKLTEEQVAEIKKMRNAGMRYRDIAAKFGVSITTAQQAFTGTRWKHLGSPPPRPASQGTEPSRTGG